MANAKRAFKDDSDLLNDNSYNNDFNDVAAEEASDTKEFNKESVRNDPDEAVVTASSSLLSSLQSALFDAIPSLDDQRLMVANLWNQFNDSKKEGDKIYIIPENWLSFFQDATVSDYTLLPPLDIESIVIDYDNFILQNYAQNPYTPVPESIFNLFQQWYELTPGSRPLFTYLVKDVNNQLIVEYDRPRFRLHYLTATSDIRGNGFNNHRYSTETNRNPVIFTMSRLSSMKDVVNRCLDVFYERESYIERRVTKSRIWYVKGHDDTTDRNQTLNSSYRLSPKTFIEFPTKLQIKRDMFSKTINDYDSQIVDLAVEIKRRDSQEHWASNFFYYNKLQPSSGTTGLLNLGNTCYMNSALQCLLHVPELNSYFLYGIYEKEINTGNPLGHKGHIAHAFGQLAESLFGAKSTPQASFAPRAFKSTIGHYNAMFAGFGQQDSQEFLAFVLDGLHEDLNRVKEKPYLEKPELPNNCSIGDLEEIKALANKTWEYIKKRNDSVIMDLFVGLYKSTLICPSCDNVSITFDPYNNLTLPLPIENYWRNKVTIFPQNTPPCTLEVELAKTCTYQDLKKYIADAIKMNVEDLIGFEIFNHQFYNNYEANLESDYLPLAELISDNDTVIFYEVSRNDGDILVPVFNSKIEEGFRTPKLFGYPFFISLTKEEQCSYGAIRKKLEYAYKHMSGGFTNFPLIGNCSNIDTIDSLPLLAEKYSESDIRDIEDELQYINTEVSPDEFFEIKVSKGETPLISSRRAGRYTATSLSEGTEAVKDKVWTPIAMSNMSQTSSFPIRDNLPNILNDAYYYSEMNYSPKTVSESQEDQKPADDIQDDENMCSSEDSTDEIHYHNKKALINGETSIICQWRPEKVSEVFENESDINWDNPAHLTNEALDKLRRERAAKADTKITLDGCLRSFSQPEVLSSADSWYCPKCKQHTQASKQIVLWNSPDILLINLKRFENQRSFSDKIDATVQFPIEGFDMSPYLSYTDDNTSNMYDLIAVDNHYGGLGGGHYTAYVRNFIDGKWYYFDDSRVSETLPENSVSGSAYLLFYRRRTTSNKPLVSKKLKDIIDLARNEQVTKNLEFQERMQELYERAKSDEEDEYETEYSISSNDINIMDGKMEQTTEGSNDIPPTAQPSLTYHPFLKNETSTELSSSELSFLQQENNNKAKSNIFSFKMGDRPTKIDDFTPSRRKVRILDKLYPPAPSTATSGSDSVSSPSMSDSDMRLPSVNSINNESSITEDI